MVVSKDLGAMARWFFSENTCNPLLVGLQRMILGIPNLMNTVGVLDQ